MFLRTWFDGVVGTDVLITWGAVMVVRVGRNRAGLNRTEMDRRQWILSDINV